MRGSKWSLEVKDLPWLVRARIAWQVICQGILKLDSSILPDCDIEVNPHYKRKV